MDQIQPAEPFQPVCGAPGRAGYSGKGPAAKFPGMEPH